MLQKVLIPKDEKTEVIVIRNRQQIHKIDIPHININGSDIEPTTNVLDIGLMFDLESSMKVNRSPYLLCGQNNNRYN